MDISKIVKSKNKLEKAKAFKKLRFKNISLLVSSYLCIITLMANSILTGTGFINPFVAAIINAGLACIVGLLAEENNRVCFQMTILVKSGL